MRRYTAQDFYDDIARIVRQVISKMLNPWVRLAIVDSAYTTGLPKLQFEGEVDEDGVTPVLSTKQYSHLSSYSPAANDRVVVVKIAATWIIIGKVVGP